MKCRQKGCNSSINLPKKFYDLANKAQNNKVSLTCGKKHRNDYQLDKLSKHPQYTTSTVKYTEDTKQNPNPIKSTIDTPSLTQEKSDKYFVGIAERIQDLYFGNKDDSLKDSTLKIFLQKSKIMSEEELDNPLMMSEKELDKYLTSITNAATNLGLDKVYSLKDSTDLKNFLQESNIISAQELDKPLMMSEQELGESLTFITNLATTLRVDTGNIERYQISLLLLEWAIRKYQPKTLF